MKFLACCSLVLIFSLNAWSKDIVIIGAGFAGLTAAYEIQKAIDAKEMPADTRVRVFEARERVGGRVFSVLLNGKPAELGGENINDGGDAIQLRRVAAELGLKIDSRTQQPTVRYFYDAKMKTRIALDDLKPYFPKLEKEELIAALERSEKGARSLSEVLDHFFAQYPVSKKFEKDKRALIRRILEEDMRSFEGGAPKDLSPRYAHGSLVDMAKEFLNRPKKPYQVESIAGGNSQLAIALAAKLKEKIHLASPLMAVSKSKDGSYDLTIGDKVVHADVLVLALPCKPYASVKFGDDVIPADRLKRILKVAYGTHAKILLPIKGESSKELPNTEGVLVWQRPGDLWLTAYFTGPLGVMRNSAELKTGAALVEAAFKPPAPFANIGEIKVPLLPLSEFQTAIAMSWTTEPYTRGSYSYFTPELREVLETTVTIDGESVATLFAPIDRRLFFAGEHTTIDQDIRGTMEAAVDSGVRTARLVRKFVPVSEKK